jgi:hypothetical protein
MAKLSLGMAKEASTMGQVLKIAFVALLIGAGLSPDVGETAVMRLTLEDLSREADTIVLGTVTGRVSAWNDRRTAIQTDVTVTIEETIKGSPGAEITFRVAGGIVGDIGMRTSTAPVLHDGDQVVLFLNTGGVPTSVVGHHQGALTVQDGTVAKDGQRLAVDNVIRAIRAATREE